MIDPAKYEYQGEFARDWFAHGREEGKAEGWAALTCRKLAVRFGELPAGVDARIRSTSIDQLDAIGERLLTAPTLQEALGQH